jgi:hypothetical protein
LHGLSIETESLRYLIFVGVQGVELDDFVSGPRELLLKLVEEHYPLPQDPKHAEGLYQSFASDENFLGLLSYCISLCIKISVVYLRTIMDEYILLLGISLSSTR